jgi:hypothetical protein
MLDKVEGKCDLHFGYYEVQFKLPRLLKPMNDCFVMSIQDFMQDIHEFCDRVVVL